MLRWRCFLLRSLGIWPFSIQGLHLGPLQATTDNTCLHKTHDTNHSLNLHLCFHYLTYLIPSSQAICQPSIEPLMSQFLKLC